MKRQLSYFVFSSFLLTGCWDVNSAVQQPILTNEDENVVVLFSDDHSLQEESSFYDALLEVQQSHPQYAIPLRIIGEQERSIIRHYNINQYPTLLIINTEGINLRIEGSHPKEEIVTLLKQALHIVKEGSLY